MDVVARNSTSLQSSIPVEVLNSMISLRLREYLLYHRGRLNGQAVVITKDDQPVVVLSAVSVLSLVPTWECVGISHYKLDDSNVL